MMLGSKATVVQTSDIPCSVEFEVEVLFDGIRLGWYTD